MAKAKSRTKAKKAKSKKDTSSHKIKASESIPTSWQLLKTSFSFIKQNYKPLSILTLIYGVVTWSLVGIGDSATLEEVEQSLEEDFGRSDVDTAVLAGVVLSVNGTSSSSEAYPLVLFAIFSLAFIWAIRRSVAGMTYSFKEPFYRGMQPLIPFLLILLLVVVQLIPFFIGGIIYSFVTIGGATDSFLQQLPFLVLWILLGTLSAYWISVSLMSLYAVTLPDMFPRQALKAVKKVVEYRRWQVFKRILFLPAFLVIFFGIFFFAIVAFVPSISFATLDIIGVIGLPLTHIYYFHLYKSLV